MPYSAPLCQTLRYSKTKLLWQMKSTLIIISHILSHSLKSWFYRLCGTFSKSCIFSYFLIKSRIFEKLGVQIPKRTPTPLPHLLHLNCNNSLHLRLCITCNLIRNIKFLNTSTWSGSYNSTTPSASPDTISAYETPASSKRSFKIGFHPPMPVSWIVMN